MINCHFADVHFFCVYDSQLHFLAFISCYSAEALACQLFFPLEAEMQTTFLSLISHVIHMKQPCHNEALHTWRPPPRSQERTHYESHAVEKEEISGWTRRSVAVLLLSWSSGETCCQGESAANNLLLKFSLWETSTEMLPSILKCNKGDLYDPEAGWPHIYLILWFHPETGHLTL